MGLRGPAGGVLTPSTSSTRNQRASIRIESILSACCSLHSCPESFSPCPSMQPGLVPPKDARTKIAIHPSTIPLLQNLNLKLHDYQTISKGCAKLMYLYGHRYRAGPGKREHPLPSFSFPPSPKTRVNLALGRFPFHYPSCPIEFLSRGRFEREGPRRYPSIRYEPPQYEMSTHEVKNTL